MDKNELKRQIFDAIDRKADDIIGLGQRIRSHPELGFKETKTSRLVAETLAGLGLVPQDGLALTGVRAEAAGRGGDGPAFAILGELDGLVVARHPQADPSTGAPAACGRQTPVCRVPGSGP